MPKNLIVTKIVSNFALEMIFIVGCVRTQCNKRRTNFNKIWIYYGTNDCFSGVYHRSCCLTQQHDLLEGITPSSRVKNSSSKESKKKSKVKSNHKRVVNQEKSFYNYGTTKRNTDRWSSSHNSDM